MGLRVGLGYDVHPLADGRPLVLGGVTIEHPRGLAGYSDADAVCHAVADAVLGALGLGDLGAHFPDDDPQWRNAESWQLLRRVAQLAGEHGARLVNADLVIVADEPRLAPHVEALCARLAEALGADASQISVKPKRTEGLGGLAGGRGISAQAVVLLEVREEGAA